MQPPRILIYGPPGVGKTTTAAKAPDCIIVQTEEGAGATEISALDVATVAVQVDIAATAPATVDVVRPAKETAATSVPTTLRREHQ